MGERSGFQVSGFGSRVSGTRSERFWTPNPVPRTRIAPGLVALLSVLLALCCPGWAQEYHDKVVIILDASGSMASPMGSKNIQKIAAAKAALKEVMTKIPETTHVGLLVFSGKNVPDKWLYPLGPRDNAALTKAIDLPQPGGNTPLGQFIKIGADRLLEERAKQFGYGSYRLLIVTDGEATDGQLTERYTPEVVARGITVDVIGVDMKQDHTLATKVHSYRRADDPEALKKALSDILAEVSSSGAADAATQEAFDLLAPIPAELCASMLEALSRLGNQPIGAKPGAGPPVPRAKADATKPQSPAPGSKNQPSGGAFGATWLIIALVFLGIGGVVRRGRRRR